MTAEQLDLILSPTHRATDPTTSAQAVPSDEHLSKTQALVRDTIARRSGGMTDAELCDVHWDLTPGTLIKRRTELVQNGLLRDSGKRRPVRRTGRAAVVWEVVA